MAGPLRGARVALLVAPNGTEHADVAAASDAVGNAGGEVRVLSLRPGSARTVHHDLEEAELVGIDGIVAEADVDAYDALIVPGGTVGVDRLRADEAAVRFVRAFFREAKLVGATGHGAWALVEADVLRDRVLTSAPSLRTDVRNAGGEWRDVGVVRDGALVTSRGREDRAAFCEAIVAALAEARREGEDA